MEHGQNGGNGLVVLDLAATMVDRFARDYVIILQFKAMVDIAKDTDFKQENAITLPNAEVIWLSIFNTYPARLPKYF